jgi:hypothetical protein
MYTPNSLPLDCPMASGDTNIHGSGQPVNSATHAWIFMGAADPLTNIDETVDPQKVCSTMMISFVLTARPPSLPVISDELLSSLSLLYPMTSTSSFSESSDISDELPVLSCLILCLPTRNWSSLLFRNRCSLASLSLCSWYFLSSFSKLDMKSLAFVSKPNVV